MPAQSTLMKQTHALMDLYVKSYTEKYGAAPRFNRYREKWGFQSMIEDLGYDRAREVVGYYMSTRKIGHPVSYLLFNYDKLAVIKEELDNDEIIRKELLKQTEQRVKEWDEQNGNERSQSNIRSL